MCSNAVVIVSIGSENPAQILLAQDNDVIQTLARIDPINRSAKPFCQGEAGAVGLSRIPMAMLIRRITPRSSALPIEVSGNGRESAN